MPGYPLLFLLVLLVLHSNVVRANEPLQHVGQNLWQLLAGLLIIIATLLFIGYGLKLTSTLPSA